MMDSEDRNRMTSLCAGQDSHLESFDPNDQIRDFDIDGFIETDLLLQVCFVS